AIQGSGDRRSKPFVTVNCGAIPDNLVESILFGHEKGSFTGATDKHTGKFVEANSGTLFLDEIGDLPLDVQVKLLRAVQE
ncbi:sigma 54-interacting transcriptional regulator, partial [Mesorhizobium sp.]